MVESEIGAELAPAAKVLASASLFSAFSRDELEFLAERSELAAYEDGSLIFDAGDAGDRLYVLASGSVVIHAPADGSALAELVPGDSFGELELLTGAKRNAQARAGGATILLAFPSGGAGLEETLFARPELAARILRSFLLVVAGRTRKANALVKENSPWVRELRRQVYGDKLTGLFNKVYLEENLTKMLHVPSALVMMKPDNFKEINDRFGHEAGDAVLVLMAGELESAVGKDGTAIRYLGNELAVLYPKMDKEAALDAARALRARFSSLDLSRIVGDDAFRLSASFGIAMYPEHGVDGDALIKASSGLPLTARSRGGSLILFPEDEP